MNLFTRITGLSLVLIAQLFAAAPFEGTVSFDLSANGRGTPQSLSYAIKGQLVRVEIQAEGQAFASIIDPGKQEMTILMPDQGMYMVMPMKAGMEAAAKAGGVESTAQVERTGKTEKILGYQCEQVLVKDKGQVTELWLAEGLGTFAGLGSGNPLAGGKKSAAASKWEEALKGIGGFPLRVISRDSKSKEVFKMEAKAITPGPLPASHFQSPAGLQKFSMPAMGGMNPFN